MIVGTGDFANGMVQAGDGIHKAGYTYPGTVVAPRFGVAYDLTGDQATALRGAVGLYFDRPDGNMAFGTVANPPTATGLTQQWGSLADIANSQLAFGPVPKIVVNLYDSAMPKDFQWNIGVQRRCRGSRRSTSPTWAIMRSTSWRDAERQAGQHQHH